MRFITFIYIHNSPLKIIKINSMVVRNIVSFDYNRNWYLYFFLNKIFNHILQMTGWQSVLVQPVYQLRHFFLIRRHIFDRHFITFNAVCGLDRSINILFVLRNCIHSYILVLSPPLCYIIQHMSLNYNIVLCFVNEL